jgi:hypothetical protein
MLPDVAIGVPMTMLLALGEPDIEARDLMVDELEAIDRPDELGDNVDRPELLVESEASDGAVPALSELRAELDITLGKNASELSSNDGSFASSSAGRHASRERVCDPTEFGARPSFSRGFDAVVVACKLGDIGTPTSFDSFRPSCNAAQKRKKKKKKKNPLKIFFFSASRVAKRDVARTRTHL